MSPFSFIREGKDSSLLDDDHLDIQVKNSEQNGLKGHSHPQTDAFVSQERPFCISVFLIFLLRFALLFVPLHAQMKISVITVTYNSAATVEDAMASVLSQTWKDIEYIVVDGGSSDATLDIVRSYEPRFGGRMKWISEPDNGIYDAMNKGVRMATGDVVGILNSDDFFTSDDVVAHVVESITPDVEGIYGDVHFVKGDDLTKNVRTYSGRMFRPWMVRMGFIPPHPSLYLRRRVYERYGLYDSELRISADFELIANIAYVNNVKLKYVNLDVVTMRTGGESTKSLLNRRLGTREDLIACRKLNIRTNWLLIHMKYLLKLYGALRP